jgi:nitrogen fixation/metabolism regulation signal transduction histidine kinase
MKEISEGNISKHIELESGDEFADVARGINAMLSDLQEREDEDKLRPVCLQARAGDDHQDGLV